MELIIAILLWMNVLTPKGEYTQEEFDMLVAANQPAIETVLADPTLTETAWTETQSDIPAVIIGEGD